MEEIVLTIASLLLLLTAHYVYFLTRVRIGLGRLPQQPQTGERPTVSIVVAARNEEAHIVGCVRSLLAQDYPTALLEVTIVDDHSTDNTASLVKGLSAQDHRVRVLSASDVLAGPSGKAAALHQGILASRGSIIATTDADCLVPGTWVRSLVSWFGPGVSIVSGPVLEQPKASLFSRLEAMEFFGLIAVGAGLIGAGRPIICNGANLAFRRSAFDAVGGYGEGPLANDDEGLMNKIVVRKAGLAAFAWTPEALVRTSSNNTPWTFFRQRVRWSSKKGRYEDGSILATLVLLYFFFVVILAAGAVAFWEPHLAIPVLLVFFGKVALEYALLRTSGRRFAVRIDAIPFLIAQLLHVPYIVTAAAVGQFARSSWKA
jgi:biofilm PGA synthesis N-glycosyltransferase PgaC